MTSINEIETLVAVAKLGSLTRASRRLHRTQPAIPIAAIHRLKGYLSPAAKSLLHLLVGRGSTAGS
jgi:Bacterial regulatory helix-turn-helix protein, lysR family